MPISSVKLQQKAAGYMLAAANATAREHKILAKALKPKKETVTITSTKTIKVTVKK